MKLISIVTPCYNEEENVEALFKAVSEIFAEFDGYRFEHVFIDNASSDHTVERIKAMAAVHPEVKLIVNTRNFGHIRSPMHAFYQVQGDAVVVMAADFQSPPELLGDFVRYWEEGAKIVVGVKTSSDEPLAMWLIRRTYYRLAQGIADIQLIQNFTGYGLYDRVVVEHLRSFNEPYPYFRGQVSEVGYPIIEIPFKQPTRKRGITKNNFYTLFDLAMLGITSHSKIPLRLATMAGFALAGLSLMVAIGYLVAKLLFWDSFSMGMVPLISGVFFLGSVQLFFIGILGEYIGAIHTNILKRPFVIEKERVNFDQGESNRGCGDDTKRA